MPQVFRLSQTAWQIFFLFFPAALGLWWQIIHPNPLHHQLLALGLFLLAVDQARMAVIDLEQIALVKTKIEDIRLIRFYWVTISTIAIELIGFYLASFYLGIGILFVLGSQVWFNLIVRIRLEPDGETLVQMRPWVEKILLILGNLLGMALMVLWLENFAPMLIVSGLWLIAISYALVKIVQALQT